MDHPLNAVRDLGGPRRLPADSAHDDRQAIPNGESIARGSNSDREEPQQPMTTFDNAPALDGWTVTARCCGLLHETIECSVCGEFTKPEQAIPPLIELGEN